MKNLDLNKYGIIGTKEIVYNPSYDELFDEETKPELDKKRFESVLDKLNIQYEDAKEWRDVCLSYFLKFAEGEK